MVPAPSAPSDELERYPENGELLADVELLEADRFAP